LQEAYNKKHGITPRTVKKAIKAGIETEAAAHAAANAAVGRDDETQYITEEYINELEAEMMEAASQMEFERAAAIRDRIEKMRESIGQSVKAVEEQIKKGGKKQRGRRGTKKAKVPRPKKGA
ncbi:MAG: UvrB/UvrC motif-containing protein, partial [Planctomycetota bacterium]